MKLVPLGDRVVLKQVAAEETTKSGIVIPVSYTHLHPKQVLYVDLGHEAEQYDILRRREE